MPGLYDPLTLTPSQFEEEVENLIRELGARLTEFKTNRLERLKGNDGTYEIDITARFEALGGNFLVLIECKHHKNPIKRDMVQVLYDRLRSVGAQKGMLFSTARFQPGAIDYALKHGIALIQIADGRTSYFAKSGSFSSSPSPSWGPARVGWMISVNEDGDVVDSLICNENPHLLRDWLTER